MSVEWFDGCSTVDEVKAQYRELAMAHHPDRGGSTEVMAEINEAYHAELASRQGEVRRDETGAEHAYYYKREREQAAMDLIYRLLSHRLPDVEVWLIGTWVWVTGDTKPVKETLKRLGLRWHSKRECWYWKPKGSRRQRYNAKASFSDIAAAHGATFFEAADEEEAVARAS